MIWLYYIMCKSGNFGPVTPEFKRVVGVNPLVPSLLLAGAQPTLDSSADTFMSVQCASPGRGGELVGVCGV